MGLAVGDDFYFDPRTKHYTGELKVLEGRCPKIRFPDKVPRSEFFDTAQEPKAPSIPGINGFQLSIVFLCLSPGSEVGGWASPLRVAAGGNASNGSEGRCRRSPARADVTVRLG